MKHFYTYLHCKPNGDPFYVGKGCGRRSNDFTGGRNQHHKNIIAKHGKENILVYVFPCNSEAEAFADEIQQIAQLRAEGYDLCNQTYGGEGAAGLVCLPETRKKLAAANAGKQNCLGHKQSGEHKMHISMSLRGKRNALGHIQSEQHKLAGAKARTGVKRKPFSPEHLENLSIASRHRWSKNAAKS